MRNLIATVYFLLSLFGCVGAGTTLVTHSSTNGVDQIYSRTRITAGIARFECIRSASGRCHYTLFPRECASTSSTGKDAGECKSQPIERFTMAAGDSREVVGLPSQFDMCVSQDADPLTPDCVRSRSTSKSTGGGVNKNVLIPYGFR